MSLRAVILLACAFVAVTARPELMNHKGHQLIHRRAVVAPKTLPKIAEVARPKPRAVDGCGIGGGSSAADLRIVGGKEATPHAYPWQVALTIDDRYFCGGSIISTTWVLTAAHCMDGAGFVDVLAGAHSRSSSEPSQVEIYSTSFKVHENYQSLVIQQDIAVIELPSPLTVNDEIRPICLPASTDEDVPVGTYVVATGWGKTSDGVGGVSDILMEVSVPVISNADCEAVYGSASVGEGNICIDSTGGMGTCNGDSGGPLNYLVDGLYYHRGITSYGASAGCEAGYPDSFTRTKFYLPWIADNTDVPIDL